MAPQIVYEHVSGIRYEAGYGSQLTVLMSDMNVSVNDGKLRDAVDAQPVAMHAIVVDFVGYNGKAPPKDQDGIEVRGVALFFLSGLTSAEDRLFGVSLCKRTGRL